LSHYRLPSAILPAIVAGLLLGLVALRKRSIWPPVALHAAVNALPILVTEELVLIPGFNDVQTQVSHIPLSLLFGSSLIGLVAVALLVATANTAGDGGQSSGSRSEPDTR
jgi:hypothetical protein